MMFTRARIKLTVFYMIILACVMAVFSLLLFHYTVQHIRDTIEENSPSYMLEQKIADRTIDDLLNTLVISDFVVIVLTGVLSYLLAGRTLRPIKTAHEAQAQFSANASHELRTPLSVMKTENEVFLRQGSHSSTEGVRLAESNLEEIERMMGMVENLLLLARTRKSHPRNSFEKIDIVEVLENTIHRQERSVKVKNLEIVFAFSRPIYVLGNAKLLEQLFTNIIQNAITYTEKGSVRVTIESGGEVRIKIEDTGIGIASVDLPHIEEAFYKADSSRTVTSSGVGLGLSIAREIVNVHKGRIQIESELGRGTTVLVTLPSYENRTI